MSALDPDARTLLDRWASAPTVSVDQLSAQTVRDDDAAVLGLQEHPVDLYAIQDVDWPGPAGPMRARVYQPKPGPLRTMVYFPGGGFVIGPAGYDAPLRQLSQSSGCMIVAPRCRLAPEYGFPAATEDATAAARWLADDPAAVGGCVGPVGIAGDSSGGNLAAVAAQTLTRSGIGFAFQVLIYPMLDATASSQSYQEYAVGYGFSRAKSLWYFDQYLRGDVDRRSPNVSPLFERQLAGLPPTLIVTAECDPLRDDGETYAARLREAGVDVDLSRYPGTIHGFFQMTAALQAARRLHGELGQWIRTKVE